VRRRLDVELVRRGLVESRARAVEVITAGRVLVQGAPAMSVSRHVAADESVSVEGPGRRFVSRGGDKLDAALIAFSVVPRGRRALDAGASTGGFTDCLLQQGARRVCAVDVGHGQLDYRLRQDPRVVVMERVNARYLGSLPEEVDLATVDVSFIGLEVILPAVAGALKPGAPVVALFKPQFQARKGEVGKGGVVRDPLLIAALVGRFVAWAVGHGFRIRGLTRSPLLGPAGNQELFVLLEATVPVGRKAGSA
jgi:23S rRNA (cytidine1920-2'-O)/16S rRNA (cytidine1409-2'-O)-methyltransferase